MNEMADGRLTSTLAALLLLTGCVGADAYAPLENVGEADEAVATSNALTMNALTMNALTMNALTMNALTMNALTMDGAPIVGTTGTDVMRSLAQSSLGSLELNQGLLQALADETEVGGYYLPRRGDYTRDLLTYVYSCAAPPGSTLTISSSMGYTIDPPLVLQGELGLAPEWESGPCGQGCKELVSGCVLARTNAFGKAVDISVRMAPITVPPTAEELSTYTHFEGAFFGNLFGSEEAGQPSSWDGTLKMYACHAGATDTLLQMAVTHRACTLAGGYCPIEVVGHCDDLCASGPDGYTSCTSPDGTSYQPIMAYLAPETPTCGNMICEAGETELCPVDCAQADVVIRSVPWSAQLSWVAAAADPAPGSSSVVVVGEVYSPYAGAGGIVLGGVPLEEQSSRDLILAKYVSTAGETPSGNAIEVAWAIRLPLGHMPDGRERRALDVAVSAEGVDGSDGDVIVGGLGFIARHDKHTGARSWDKLWSGEYVSVDNLTFTSSGDVAASLSSDMDSVLLAFDTGNGDLARIACPDGGLTSVQDRVAIGGQAVYHASKFQYSPHLRLYKSNLDCSGMELFVIPLPGFSYPAVDALEIVESTGDIIVAGRNQLHSTPLVEPFLAKVSPTGQLLWLSKLGGFATAMTLRELELRGDKIYVGGDYSGPVVFKGSLDVEGITPPFHGDADAFVARFDSDGHLEWTRTYGGTYTDGLLTLSVDSAGHLWTLGHFITRARIDWRDFDAFGQGLFIERSLAAIDLAKGRPLVPSSAHWELDLGGSRHVDHVLIDTSGSDAALEGFSIQTSGDDGGGFTTRYTHAPGSALGGVVRVDVNESVRYLRAVVPGTLPADAPQIQAWGY